MRPLPGAVLIAVVAGLTFGSAPIAAQAPGIPVLNSGFARGFTLASMVGFANAAAGEGTGLAVSGVAGFRRIAFGGFVSGLSGSSLSDERVLARGATVAIKLAGGPLVPVGITLMTGAGYFAPPNSHSTNWRVPVGLGISWTVPQPVVALRFWASPRLDYSRDRGPDPLATPGPNGPVPLRTTTQSDFGLSGGINFGFLNGFGLDVAVDRRFTSATDGKPAVLGLGASYRFE